MLCLHRRVRGTRHAWSAAQFLKAWCLWQKILERSTSSAHMLPAIEQLWQQTRCSTLPGTCTAQRRNCTPCAAGQELGHYQGSIDTLRSIERASPGTLPLRAQQLIQDLQTLLDSFPAQHPQDASLHERIDALRAKHKATLACVGVGQHAASAHQTDVTF